MAEQFIENSGSCLNLAVGAGLLVGGIIVIYNIGSQLLLPNYRNRPNQNPPGPLCGTDSSTHSQAFAKDPPATENRGGGHHTTRWGHR